MPLVHPLLGNVREDQPAAHCCLLIMAILRAEVQVVLVAVAVEETLCMQARNATASKTLITPTPNTTHTNPQSSWGDIMQ